jgi:sec-independent protein translocase protein TatB
MFEVGFTEIVLIFGIALLVLGPQRLPKLAADLGRWAGRARSMARQLRTQLEQETQFDPLADTKPAAHAGRSETIHTPPPVPPADDDDARAAPTQLAAPAASAEPALNPAVDAPGAPDATVADEPKPG